MKSNAEVLRYIRSGINKTATFNYDGKSLTLRPLRSTELDNAKVNGYKYVNPSMAKLLLNIYIGKVDAHKLRSDYPVDMYKNFDKYYREIDYWLVYHSMKDFCDDDFSIEDVRKMRYVHDIAKYILSITVADTPTITRVLKTEEGQKIATLIHIYHQPLATINDMTPSQEDFIYQSDPSRTPEKIEVDNIEELEDLMTYMKGVNKYVGK